MDTMPNKCTNRVPTAVYMSKLLCAYYNRHFFIEFVCEWNIFLQGSCVLSILPYCFELPSLLKLEAMIASEQSLDQEDTGCRCSYPGSRNAEQQCSDRVW